MRRAESSACACNGWSISAPIAPVRVPLINTVAAPTSSAISLYNVPAVYGRHRLMFTNTTPTTAYRGAGRPNVSYLWERLVEEAAKKLGIDSIKLRRRNLLKTSQFPLKTPTGSTYDSADPAGLLDTRPGQGGVEVFREAPAGGKEGRTAARHRAGAVPRALRRRRPRGGQDRDPIRWTSLRCTRSPARRDRGTKPCFPTWSRKSSVCPTIASSCGTTTTRCRNWPGPAASDRAR